ncbi:MAG: hypothetical protein JOZ88_14655 [Hyphomicrobiales bacterium]|nr:hypothetical protein [Hyphomicrobiales bacterium]
MDRTRLEQHLRLVDDEIAANEGQMRRLCELIAKLERGGQDSSEMRKRLIALEAFQALRLADRELIQQELALFRQKRKKIW